MSDFAFVPVIMDKEAACADIADDVDQEDGGCQ